MMRNDLVYSEMKISTPSSNIYFQEREMGLWYVEWMLLHIYGYKGKF